MSETIKLFFCTDGIFPNAVGGMQRHSRLLIEKLSQYSDLDITVIHPHQGMKLFESFSSVKEIAIPMNFEDGVYLRQCYKYSKEVYRYVSEHPDAIIYSQGLAVWYKASRLSNRLIINPHGLEPYQTLSIKDKLLGSPFRLIFNSLFRKAAKVVSLGGKLTTILAGIIDPDKIAVLPNAINKIDEQPRSFHNRRTKFLFVGRFAFNKGIGVLLEAVKNYNLNQPGNDLEFYLVGKGPLYESMSTSYVFSNLHYVGFADDDKLNELYSTCDVFILPTLFEGMPTVVLEAMAHSMAIIVTDVGATREMVDQTNGYIIEKNSVNSLMEAVNSYLALSTDKKVELASNSYNKATSLFTWDIVAKKHYHLFKEMAQNNNG